MAPRLAMLALAALLTACQIAPPAPPAVAERPAGDSWRAVARTADVERVDGLATPWQAGIAAVRAARLPTTGALLAPDAALPRVTPPPGSYQCRVTRLGAGPGRRALIRYPVYFCHVGVAGAWLSFAKQTGAERFDGYLYPDSDARLIFLGATAAAGEALAPGYGANEARNLVGVFERVGPMRYRLVIPSRAGARLDVIELAPITAALE